MTALQFINKINEVGSPLNITGYTFSDSVTVTEKLPAKGIIIKDCVFKENISFDSVEIIYGIEFINCTFLKKLTFNSAQVVLDGILSEFGNKPSISIINSKVNTLSFRGSCTFRKDICITNKSEIESFLISENFETDKDIIISNSTINYSLHFSNTKSNRIVFENNSNINSLIRLENIKSNSIVFKKSIFNDEIYLWDSNIDDLIFFKSIFNRKLEINTVVVSHTITIMYSEFNDSLFVYNKNSENDKIRFISKLYISTSIFSNQFVIKGKNTEVEKIKIIASKKLEGTLSFTDLNILETNISGDISNCNLIFNHCNFNYLLFSNFYNYSTISLSSVESYKTNSSINIENSNLGKTHLFNTSLNSFDSININNSFLMDIISANVKWFSDDRLNSDKKEELNFFDQKREIYRQLKYALDKQGDRITTLKFKAMEMEAYKNHVFLNKTMTTDVSVFDKFILWLSQINDFGINWFKPTLFAIGFSILFHFLITIGVSDNLSFKPNCSDGSLRTTCEIYFANLYTLPQLMNPVHNLSHIYPKLELSFTVHFFDYLLKLILAFLIFQIISAFRKYIK